MLAHNVKDPTLSAGSDDPPDPSATRRVLTICWPQNPEASSLAWPAPKG